MNKFLLICSLIVSGVSILNASNSDVNGLSTDKKMVVQSDVLKTAESIFSYEDILFSYYEIALNEKTSKGLDFIDFSTFCDYYYQNSLDILTFTEMWASIDTSDFFDSLSMNNIPSLCDSSASIDADYILNSTQYDTTPTSVFKRSPIYKFNYYSFLDTGDIIYETITSPDTGHITMITDLQKSSESYGYYCETIEAVAGGVQHGFLDDDRIARYGVKILRVTSSGRFLDDALFFINEQLGKPYSLNPLRANTSINSASWYCSELVWAAYYYGGIDIATVNGAYLGDEGNSGGPLPYTLYVSDFTYEIIINEHFLRLGIVRKSGSTWTIRITNPNDFAISVEYNKKMCFLDDCTNWSNLSDITSITIGAYSYSDVSITENWFASSITSRYEINGFYYYSYADSLVSATKEMSIKYAVVAK